MTRAPWGATSFELRQICKQKWRRPALDDFFKNKNWPVYVFRSVTHTCIKLFNIREGGGGKASEANFNTLARGYCKMYITACMYTHTHTCTHACTCKYILLNIHTPIHACRYTCTHACTCICMHTFIHLQHDMKIILNQSKRSL